MQFTDKDIHAFVCMACDNVNIENSNIREMYFAYSSDNDPEYDINNILSEDAYYTIYKTHSSGIGFNDVRIWGNRFQRIFEENSQNNVFNNVIDITGQCVDMDSDGYGVCPGCGVIKGCTLDGDDCNDNNVEINPGSHESYNGVDDDCDGLIDLQDNDIFLHSCLADLDRDGSIGWGDISPLNEHLGSTNCGFFNNAQTDWCYFTDINRDGAVNDIDSNIFVFVLSNSPGTCDCTVGPELCDSYDNDCNNAIDDDGCVYYKCHNGIQDLGEEGIDCGGICPQACGECTSDADCTDNNVCNGQETCLNTQCQAGTPLSCNDNLFCNGQETCNVLTGCQFGTAPNCNDNLACTTDSCSEANDNCAYAPNNNLCNDNLFCNGQETCDAVLGCRAGNSPDCSDGISCTRDSCSEMNDNCAHVPDNSLCSPGDICDSQQGCYTPEPLPCDLTNAYWNTGNTIEGENVQLNIEGQNCNGQQINFAVWEDDLIGDDAANVNPVSVNFVGNSATGTWTAEWQCDGNVGGVCTLGLPEYYFIATLVSDANVNIQSAPPLLTVNERSPTCGNGIVQGNEECDDGNNNNNDACTNACLNARCGDSYIREGVEICDTNSQSCTIEGYAGTQSCNNGCTGWNDCVATEFCGDNSCNGNENCSLCSIDCGVCPDTTPPIISNVENNSITNQSAVINWQTNENANGTVEYGLTTNLGESVSHSDFLISHSLLLLDLLENKTYYYKVSSCDSAGNCASSSIFHFTTLNSTANDTLGPIILLNNPTNGENLSLNNVIFNYTPSDANLISNCSIFVGAETRTDSEIENGFENSFTLDLTNGNYVWNVSCRDRYNNFGTSETWNFSIVAPYCGDGICNNEETCSSCSQDCGICGGGPGNGGGGGGTTTYQCNDGIDNDNDGKIDYPNDKGCVNGFDNSELDEVCNALWNCNYWSSCVDGKQTRSCRDLNNCGIIEGKPAEERDCGAAVGEGEEEKEGEQVTPAVKNFIEKIKAFAKKAFSEQGKKSLLISFVVFAVLIIVLAIVLMLSEKRKKHTEEKLLSKSKLPQVQENK